MAAGIRTSTTTDWLTNAGIAPSSDRTALGRTLRLSAPDRSPAGNAWCLGSPRESRARQATPLSPSEPHFVRRTEEPPVLKMKRHCEVSYRERACDLPREMHFLAVIRLASNHNRSNPSCERMKIRVRLLHTLRPVLSADRACYPKQRSTAPSDINSRRQLGVLPITDFGGLRCLQSQVHRCLISVGGSS